MTCTHCKCTMFKPFQDGMLCVACGHLVLDGLEAPKPTTEAKATFSPNAAMCAHIKGLIKANWDEITAMRGHGIAWTTIIREMKFIFSATTLGKHYRNMLQELDPTTPKRKRGVFKNPDKIKKNFKQDSMLFGSRS